MPHEARLGRLAIYAALARTSGGETGNPLAVAKQIRPDLQYLRVTFGDHTAEESLILVAALGMAREQARWHPLLNALRKTEKITDRNIWYLHEIGELDERGYEFIVDFLAYATIAQDPRLFGLEANPVALS